MIVTDTLQLARIMYDAYGDKADWKAFNDQPMPRWEALPQHIKDRWEASAQAAVRALIGGDGDVLAR